MSTWSIYLLRDETDSLYTGISTDIERRLAQHRGDQSRGAKYSRLKKRFDLVYRCELGTRSLASRVEYRLKRLPKPQKEHLVSASYRRTDLLAFLGLLDDVHHS